jgi:hypothetical protein
MWLTGRRGVLGRDTVPRRRISCRRQEPRGQVAGFIVRGSRSRPRDQCLRRRARRSYEVGARNALCDAVAHSMTFRYRGSRLRQLLQASRNEELAQRARVLRRRRRFLASCCVFKLLPPTLTSTRPESTSSVPGCSGSRPLRAAERIVLGDGTARVRRRSDRSAPTAEPRGPDVGARAPPSNAQRSEAVVVGFGIAQRTDVGSQ